MTQARQVRPGPVLLLGGGAAVVLFLIYQFFLAPLQAYNSQLAGLEREINDKLAEITTIRKEKPLLERWREQSLPADRTADKPGYKDLAEREYARYLDHLLARSKVGVLDIHATTPASTESRGAFGAAAKKAVYTPVTFSVDARTGFAHLVQMLQRFQETPVVHKIKTLRIEPDSQGPKEKEKRNTLHVHMTVEALILDRAPPEQPNLIGAEARLLQLDVLDALRRGPAWMNLLAHVRPSRNYHIMNRKNIFTGPQPFKQSDSHDMTRFVYLNRISEDEEGEVAVLLNRYNNFEETHLRASSGANTFTIKDAEGEELVTGEVVKIGPRDVYFKMGKQIFGLHIGQALAEALQEPLNFVQLRQAGLGKQKGGRDR
jgi:hypothetical protein